MVTFRTTCSQTPLILGCSKYKCWFGCIGQVIPHRTSPPHTQIYEEHFMQRSISSSFTCFYFSGEKKALCSSSYTWRDFTFCWNTNYAYLDKKHGCPARLINNFMVFPKGFFFTYFHHHRNPLEIWWALFPHRAGATRCLAAFLNAATHTACCQVVFLNRTRAVIYSNSHIQVPSGIVSCRSKYYVLFSLLFKHFYFKINVDFWFIEDLKASYQVNILCYHETLI